MKKYLMIAFAALAVVSCSKMDDVTLTQGEIDQNKYDAAFKKYLLDGKSIAPNQTWGFSDDDYSSAAPAFTRSTSNPTVDEISVPFTDEQLATLLANAKEVTTATATQNWSGSPDFAVEMKITGTWNGAIQQASAEDWGTGDTPDTGRGHRNVYVTGTWNLNEYQKIGGKGSIVIAPTGKLVLSNNAKIEMVNEARLVVLQGGSITGAGEIIVNNGNAVGYENYNGGTIDITKFNNNFGKFFNYGTFKVNEYDAGATESNFYNHSVVNIDHTGTTPNARIFNGCQFYIKNDARLRNYEGVNGSALIVGGQLMTFGSADGTSIPSFVGLAAGALVKCGSLYNGSSWVGPTDGGYAALEIVNQIDYLTWVQDSPQTAGYFANNIYVKCGTWQNDPAGQGYHQDDPSDVDNYTVSRAEYKFWSVAANCTGNGNVTKVEDGNYEYIPADDDFVLGQAGCTPGFKIKEKETPNTANLRIIAEDLSATGASDFDFNDVVLDVTFGSPAKVVLVAAGGTLPLRINGDDTNLEVHKLFGVWEEGAEKQPMVNTGAGPSLPSVDISSKVNVSITNASEADSKLKLEVFKNGEWQEMAAPKGEPSCKLAVDPTFKILTERKSIKNEYPLFVNWATETGFTSKWW